jgi:hypothetical protein
VGSGVCEVRSSVGFSSSPLLTSPNIDDSCPGRFHRLQKHGDYEAAARHAFFSGQLEKSMYYLRMCKGASPFSPEEVDEKLIVLSI